MKIKGTITFLLISFLVSACGVEDTTVYVTKAKELGPGVAGAYFMSAKLVSETCTAVALEKGITIDQSTIEKKGMFYVEVNSLNKDETLININICENNCQFPIDEWKKIDVKHKDNYDHFVFSEKDAMFGIITKREGRFFNNKFEMKITVSTWAVFYLSSEGTVKKGPCKYNILWVGEKVLDHRMPEFPDAGADSQEGGAS